MQTQWIPTCSKVESVFRSLADSFYPSPRADEFLSPRGRLDSWRPSQRRGSHCRLRNSSERKRFVVIFVRKRGTKALAKRSYKLRNPRAVPVSVPHQRTGDSAFLALRFLIYTMTGFPSREMAKCEFASPLSLNSPEWTKSETKEKMSTQSQPTHSKTTHSFIHT